jgi:hypothetical protein
MKVTVLARCERCKKKFVFDKAVGDAPIPKESRRFTLFKEGQSLTRHHYLKSYEINKEYGRIQEILTQNDVVFCQECDAAYWENFKAATDRLESFWKIPDGEELNAQLKP